MRLRAGLLHGRRSRPQASVAVCDLVDGAHRSVSAKFGTMRSGSHWQPTTGPSWTSAPSSGSCGSAGLDWARRHACDSQCAGLDGENSSRTEPESATHSNRPFLSGVLNLHRTSVIRGDSWSQSRLNHERARSGTPGPTARRLRTGQDGDAAQARSRGNDTRNPSGDFDGPHVKAPWHRHEVTTDAHRPPFQLRILPGPCGDFAPAESARPPLLAGSLDLARV